MNLLLGPAVGKKLFLIIHIKYLSYVPGDDVKSLTRCDQS